jgi:hypothetical protein
MKDDKTFGLYLRVMAAGENPSEAAKMVTGKDGKLTDTGAEVLRWIPTAAKIFTVILNSQSDGGKAQWEFVRGSNLFPWLLCGMDPKKAADVLLKMGKYEYHKSNTWWWEGMKSLIGFMRFNPEATARILVHMPKDAIETIFQDSAVFAATLATITPFLKKFNPRLAAQLFPENLQDMLEHTSYANNVFISMFFGVELEEIVSVFQSSENNRIRLILGDMTSNSSAAQMQEIVQILKVLLQKNLLDYKEASDIIRKSVDCMGQKLSDDLSACVLHQALVQNLSDDMFARIICHCGEDADWQKKFLLTLPEERRETIQNLIETIGKEKP